MNDSEMVVVDSTSTVFLIDLGLREEAGYFSVEQDFRPTSDKENNI